MSNRPKFTAAILAFFLIICFTFSWLFSHVFSENARFENFAESIFEKEVSGNALNLHYSLAYPEKQGISRTRATLGTIHPEAWAKRLFQKIIVAQRGFGVVVKEEQIKGQAIGSTEL